MSTRNLLISIAVFFLLVNIRAAFVKLPIEGNMNARHGSFGVTLTQFVDDNSNNPKVFFMGNSVYHGTEVIPKLNEIQDNRQFKFQIGNFAFTGASIYDYVHNYNHLRQFKPDLLVVQFNPTSFGYQGPYYRNDGYKKALTFSSIGLFKEGFIRSSFSKDDICEVLCSSLFPIARTTKVDRSYVNNMLWWLSHKFTKLRLMTFFKVKLNAVGEWALNKKETQANTGLDSEDNSGRYDTDTGPPNQQEFLHAQEVMLYFIKQLKEDNQKTIFIMQPSGFPRFTIMEDLEKVLSDEPLINFVDNHDFFDKSIYIDNIHPNSVGAQLAAKRHFLMIKNNLK